MGKKLALTQPTWVQSSAPHIASWVLPGSGEKDQLQHYNSRNIIKKDHLSSRPILLTRNILKIFLIISSNLSLFLLLNGSKLVLNQISHPLQKEGRRRKKRKKAGGRKEEKKKGNVNKLHKGQLPKLLINNLYRSIKTYSNIYLTNLCPTTPFHPPKRFLELNEQMQSKGLNVWFFDFNYLRLHANELSWKDKDILLSCDSCHLLAPWINNSHACSIF